MRHVGFQSNILRLNRVFSMAWATAQLKITLGRSGQRPVGDRMSAFRQGSEFRHTESQSERSELARPRGGGTRTRGSLASTRDTRRKSPSTVVLMVPGGETAKARVTLGELPC